MPSGQKIKFTGTIERQIVAQGSKSEHEAIVLRPDGVAHPTLIIRIQGENPFTYPSLQQFVGKRVSFEAVVAPSGTSATIEKLSDIAVINPPSKKLAKNNGPRP